MQDTFRVARSARITVDDLLISVVSARLGSTVYVPNAGYSLQQQVSLLGANMCSDSSFISPGTIQITLSTVMYVGM